MSDPVAELIKKKKWVLSKNSMKIGFSGTHLGITSYQIDGLHQILSQYGFVEFHHGDCIGGDAQAHRIARLLHCRVILHPPTKSGSRAFCDFDEARLTRPYLARNKDIVRETDFLVIAPHGNREILRSGTWQTARFAKKSGKHVIQLYTEGGCVVFA